MRPAREGLDAGNAAAFKVHFWLVVQNEAMIFQGLAQAGFDALALNCPLVHRLFKKLVLITAFLFSVVHRCIGMLDQLVGLPTVSRINADADTGRNMQLMFADLVGQCECLQNFGSDPRGVFEVLDLR